jgi:site-specific recombinase XerD
VLSRFLRVLAEAGLADADPLADYRTGPGKRSWPCLVQALQAADPEAALAALRLPPVLPGPLAAHLPPYLELQRSLGKKGATVAHVLRDLDRFLQRQEVPSPQAVTPALLEQWLRSMTCIAAVRLRKLHCARRFFDHLVGLRLIPSNPVRPALQGVGRHPTSIRPFLFTREQIAAILAEAQRLRDSRQFRFRAQTCSAMLALLYALGLRHGEVCRLRVRDLDLDRQTLFIDQTKFYKSRCVPFGPKVGQRLRQFLEVRRLVLPPLRDDDPLFVTSWRRPISLTMLLAVFRDLLRTAGILSLPGRRPPRLHDLRHTFAVHRLLRWYRAGVDVQSRLPALATFLGHVKPQATEVYLTITAELLHEANARFRRHFGSVGQEEVKP